MRGKNIKACLGDTLSFIGSDQGEDVFLKFAFRHSDGVVRHSYTSESLLHGQQLGSRDEQVGGAARLALSTQEPDSASKC